ncbi:hypothetical protein [Tissierella sp.]|uniref:hypothetical protein n=1 Tax=Tissierella sp. TaxID=41274 RepID=UPI0028B19531|nr:hypothetical protein [Tissierella sp.]
MDWKRNYIMGVTFGKFEEKTIVDNISKIVEELNAIGKEFNLSESITHSNNRIFLPDRDIEYSVSDNRIDFVRYKKDSSSMEESANIINNGRHITISTEKNKMGREIKFIDFNLNQVIDEVLEYLVVK